MKRSVWLHPVLFVFVVIVEVIPLDGSHHFFIKLCPLPQPVHTTACCMCCLVSHATGTAKIHFFFTLVLLCL